MDKNINVIEELSLVLESVAHKVGKEEKFRFPSFSPLPKLFPKTNFLKIIETRDCIINSLPHNPEF